MGCKLAGNVSTGMFKHAPEANEMNNCNPEIAIQKVNGLDRSLLFPSLLKEKGNTVKEGFKSFKFVFRCH